MKYGCIAILDKCDVIIMMENWKESSGALPELNYAKENGIEIIYETATI